MTKVQRQFYDFEFIEDGHTIDPISVGFVSEDETRTFYALNWDCDYRRASPWVQKNVLPHLPPKPPVPPIYIPGESLWMRREEIGPAVLRYLNVEHYGRPELWAWYAAYDHVALAQLWGPMIDMPRELPWYTLDIKQLCYSLGDPRLPDQPKGEHDALADARHNLVRWRFLQEYAKGVDQD